MKIKSLCYILFPQYHLSDPQDNTGCVKAQGHLDAHQFIDTEGNIVEWEEDFECSCGCWDTDYPCLIYKNVKDEN